MKRGRPIKWDKSKLDKQLPIDELEQYLLHHNITEASAHYKIPKQYINMIIEKHYGKMSDIRHYLYNLRIRHYKDQIIDLFKNGCTLEKIPIKLNLPAYTCTKCLQEHFNTNYLCKFQINNGWRKTKRNRPGSKELSMLKLREDGHTLEYIGNKYGITRERVRQILSICFPDIYVNKLSRNAKRREEEKKKKEKQKEFMEQLEECIESEWSINQIMDKFNLTPHTLKQKLKDKPDIVERLRSLPYFARFRQNKERMYQIKEALRLKRNGSTIKDISEKIGCYPMDVNRFLRIAVMDERYGAGRKPFPGTEDQEVKALRHLPVLTISTMLELSTETVSKIIKAHPEWTDTYNGENTTWDY